MQPLCSLRKGQAFLSNTDNSVSLLLSLVPRPLLNGASVRQISPFSVTLMASAHEPALLSLPPQWLRPPGLAMKGKRKGGEEGRRTLSCTRNMEHRFSNSTSKRCRGTVIKVYGGGRGGVRAHACTCVFIIF